jgi:hypothetical protein
MLPEDSRPVRGRARRPRREGVVPSAMALDYRRAKRGRVLPMPTCLLDEPGEQWKCPERGTYYCLIVCPNGKRPPGAAQAASGMAAFAP